MSTFGAFRASGLVAKQVLKLPTVANSREIPSMMLKRDISSMISFPKSKVAAGELKAKATEALPSSKVAAGELKAKATEALPFSKVADLKTSAQVTEGATWYERTLNGSRELMWGPQKPMSKDEHFISGVKDSVNARITNAGTLKNEVTSKISANVTKEPTGKAGSSMESRERFISGVKDSVNATILKVATMKNEVTSKISANVTKEATGSANSSMASRERFISAVKDSVNATIEKAGTLKNEVTSKISANVTKEQTRAQQKPDNIFSRETKFMTEADIQRKITKASEDLANTAEDLVKNKVGLGQLLRAYGDLAIEKAPAKTTEDLLSKVTTSISRMNQAVTKASDRLVARKAAPADVANTKAAWTDMGKRYATSAYMEKKTSTGYDGLGKIEVKNNLTTASWWDRSSNRAYTFAFGRQGK